MQVIIIIHCYISYTLVPGLSRPPLTPTGASTQSLVLLEVYSH